MPTQNVTDVTETTTIEYDAEGRQTKVVVHTHRVDEYPEDDE